MDNFFKLKPYEQAQYLWLHGTFVGSREIDGQKVSLYSVKESFYEIQYNSQHLIKTIVEVDLETIDKYYFK